MATTASQPAHKGLDSQEHLRAVIGARRKNNIYGEQTDYIVMGLLARGIDGAIYGSGVECISMYARSAAAIYFIKVLYGDNHSVDPTVAAELCRLAADHNATPAIAFARPQAKRVKFYRVANGRLGPKITYFA